MAIGKNIRARREELGLTQRELAERMGYKSVSTIAKIETGANDIAQSKVVEFARVLNTSPAYIMGINDIPSSTEDVGRNIRARREELGWTQQELAEQMGYATKSSINKIELGVNDISQRKVFDFARVLNTSVAYIMGTSDVPTPTEDNELNKLSDAHKKLLDIIKKLNEKEAEQVLQVLQTLKDDEFVDMFDDFHHLDAKKRKLVLNLVHGLADV